MNPVLRFARRATSDDTRFRLHNWLCSRRSSERVYGFVQPKIRLLRVDDDTDLVIEGFPRSANTYAVAAFRCANGSDPVVADHLHSSASVREGVRRGLPVLVLIRDPVAACASLIQRQAVRPATALTAYIRFHRGIEPVLDRVVVSGFETTTTSFGTAIEALNRRFGTAYRVYEPTPENEAWCRDFVLAADRADQGAVRPHTVALPHAERRAGRREVVNAVLRESALVAEAQSCFGHVTDLAAT